ncbi:MAG: nicotinate-nucleotide adenylyltransferase [Thiothrix sp.]|nr:nicotinate-nucleotide adenylyltransferase [Thiothrix sp.]HPQ96506.1 nicotinate-nucleotide adenylyltransferase [Thiolinea sp.]
MIGVMGGTFDPIHFGHLRTALEIVEGCGLTRLHLIPGNIPPHRPQPQASARERFEMLRLAIGNEARFVADARELERAGASYTVDTLQSLRDEFGTRIPIGFVMGMDAFLGFRSWHRWEAILTLAHLIVVHRPGYMPDPADWYADSRVQHNCELNQLPAGRIAFQAVTQLDISATFIRARCNSGGSIRYLLPDRVRRYIGARNLYQH